jgi:hypothetical protein
MMIMENNKLNDFTFIPGYENYYMINRYGIVKRLETIIFSDKRYSNGRKLKEKIIKTHKIKIGYELVTLCKDGIKKHLYLHRILAELFVEKDDINKNVVNHIDGNKLNNNLDNLEWTTYSGNSEHAYNNKLWYSRFKVGSIEYNKHFNIN